MGDKLSGKLIFTTDSACSPKYMYPAKKVVMNACGYMEYASTW